MAMIKSVAAVVLGLAVIVGLAVATDTILQWAGVLPYTGSRKFKDWQSALALSYHALFVVLGCYVAATRAPDRPMVHAMAIGAIGLVISGLGLHAIVQLDLAPAWYGWALIALALPLAWIGGKLAGRRTT